MTAQTGLFDFPKIKQQAIDVITRPASFLQTMPVSGGYREPMAFLAVIGAAVGLLNAVFSLGSGIGAVIGSLILLPLLIPLFAFIGAGIVHVFWNILGSKQKFETSYRCVAYLFAIAPITALVGLIPYLGALLTTAWAAYLYFLASVEIHKIERKKAKTAWIIIFVIFALMGISAEKAGRALQKQYGDPQAAAEEAERAMGAFLKSIDRQSADDN